MNHNQVIREIKTAQYATFKSVMVNAKALLRTSARVNLPKSKVSAFQQRMAELNQDHYFWTQADSNPNCSDSKLVDDLDVTQFETHISFPCYFADDDSTNESRQLMYRNLDAVWNLVNTLRKNGLTVNWDGNQASAITVVFGVDHQTAKVLEAQFSEAA